MFGSNLLKQPAYSDIIARKKDNFDNTDQVMENVFWIGLQPNLTVDHLSYVVNTTKKIITN